MSYSCEINKGEYRYMREMTKELNNLLRTIIRCSCSLIVA